MISLDQIPQDAWLLIACFLPSLRDFVRLWILSKKMQLLCPKTHSIFWRSLIDSFMMSRGLSLGQTSVSMVGSFKIMRPAAPDDPGDMEDFRQLELLFAKRKCSRSGCFQWYEEWRNHRSACMFHPGKMKARGFLTCCGASSFQEPGCQKNSHNGMFHFMLHTHRPAELPVNSTMGSSSSLPAISPVKPVSSSVGRSAITHTSPKTNEKLPSVMGVR